MKVKQAIVASLAGAALLLSLAGCGSKEPEVEGVPGPAGQTMQGPPPGVQAPGAAGAPGAQPGAPGAAGAPAPGAPR